MASVVPSSKPSDVARAELALALAGRALDPNGVAAAGGDALVAGELLSRALFTAASVLGAEGIALADVVGKLEESVLKRAAGSRERALELSEQIGKASLGETGVRELRDAELFTAKVVEIAKKSPRYDRQARRWRIAKWSMLAIVVLGGLYGVFGLFGHRYKFTASSAYTGYQARGELPSLLGYDTFFHTNDEESPWVEIDLGSERDVSKVIATNRFDCCTDRALPLVISLRTESGKLHEVARRTTEFDKWTATFPVEKARFVRLTVPRKTPFHLRNVEVH